MLSRISSRLTYANVMSTIAVFIALGGTSYAAVKLSKGQVKSVHIASNAVTGAKVKNGSLTSKDFAKGALVAGPKGDTGAAGAPGEKGEKGDTGATGAAAPASDRTLVQFSRNVESGWAISTTPTLVATTNFNEALYSGEYFGGSGYTHPADKATMPIVLLAHVVVSSGTNVTCTLEAQANGGAYSTIASAAAPASAPREQALTTAIPSFAAGTKWVFRLRCQTGSGSGFARGSVAVIAGPSA